MSSSDEDVLALLLTAVGDPSARGLAAGVGRLISEARLEPGDRLPTVRRLADGLGVSPTTVSHAWRSLARVGLVEARGRSGTFVRGASRPSPARRMLSVYEQLGVLDLDLSTGVPDGSLLPDLGPALARAAQETFTSHYVDHPVLPALERILTDRWPFVPERLTVVNGALDALDRLAAVAIRFGDRVLVENPCFPPILDIVEAHGAEAVPVELDGEGPDPDTVARALALRPSVFVLQSRGHNPAGVNLSRERARELAERLDGTSVLVVEDDHAGDISNAPLASLGAHIPDQVVHIHSFAKSHGPDLRLAAIGGAAGVVDALDERRLLGPGWASRLMQSVLADLLTAPASVAAVRDARAVYARRRERVRELLAARGVPTPAGDGINLWLPVADEQSAVLVLAAAGIGAAPGTPFEVRRLPSDHLRVTVGLVSEDAAERVADALATAAGAQRRHGARSSRSSR